jgi:hypothetical protein
MFLGTENITGGKMKSWSKGRHKGGHVKFGFRTVATVVAVSVATFIPASLAGASGVTVDSLEKSCPAMGSGNTLMRVCEAPPCTNAGNYNLTVYNKAVTSAAGPGDIKVDFAKYWIEVTDPNSPPGYGYDLVDAAAVQLVPTSNSKFVPDYARFIAACAADTGQFAVGILVTNYGYSWAKADYAVSTDPNWAQSTGATDGFIELTESWLNNLINLAG